MAKQSTVINVCVFKSLLQYVKITKEDEWTQKVHRKAFLSKKVRRKYLEYTAIQICSSYANFSYVLKDKLNWGLIFFTFFVCEEDFCKVCNFLTSYGE